MLRFVRPTGRAGLWFIALMAGIALMGGTARYDALIQPFVRLFAIIIIASLALSSLERKAGFFNRALLFAAAIAALIAIQLIPLPPVIWTALPGRALFADGYRAAGLPIPWHAMNLTPDLGMNALLALLPAGATLYVLSYLRRDDVPMELATMLVLVLFAALLGTLQVAQGADSPLRFYPTSGPTDLVGPFSNRNHEALFLACGIPLFAAWLPGRAQGRAQVGARLLAGGISLYLTMLCAATGSRAAIVAVLIGLSGSAMILYLALRAAPRSSHRRRSPRQKALIAGAIAAVTAVAGWCIVVIAGRSDLIARIVNFNSDTDVRAGTLRPLWTTLNAFMPFGSGFGSFASVYRAFEPFENLRLTYLNQAHNEPLQIVIEGGIPGLILIVIFAIWWARIAFRVWRSNDHRSAVMLAGRAGTVITLMAMVASLPDYPLRTPLMSSFFVVACVWMRLAAGRIAGKQALPDRANPVRHPPNAA